MRGACLCIALPVSASRGTSAEVTADAKQQFTVKPSVAKLIMFKQLNLMHDLPMRGPLDVIFCRNVIIYFDKDTQQRNEGSA